MHTLSLLKKTVKWVREINPSQPITTGIYAWDIDWAPISDLSELDQFIINSSDIIFSFLCIKRRGFRKS